MFDNHCHITLELFDNDREKVMERAKTGLSAILCIGVNSKDSEKVLQLATLHSGFVFPVLALCQDYATTANLEHELAFLKKHASNMVALGETGLEYHHYAPKDWPRLQEVFRAQLELAETLSLPVQVHCRKAHEDTFAILKNFPKLTVIMHCFYEERWMGEALKRGYYLSLPTLKNKARDKIMRDAPLERLFAETDSPFLWPEGRNEPSNVKEVYERIASKKNIPLERVDQVLSDNFERVYRVGERAKGL